MKSLRLAAIALFALSFASLDAKALSISFTDAPLGSSVSWLVIQVPDSTFINPDPNNPFRANLPNTFIQKTFGDVGTMGLDVSFGGGVDLDWPNGIRWTERVFNSTNLAWTDYHLQLDTSSAVFFTDLPTFSPSLVVINGGAGIDSYSRNTIVKTDSLGTLTLSADRKSIDIIFANPVASGSFFDVHTPIEGLANSTFFHIDQHPTVPVPAAAWTGLAGLAGLVVLQLRRK
ncbi:MAG: VPLPA-CTERM sorting domain-containing protein [Planctomycetota bacterium]|nr:VPLPA-CTERM sorting domain-containing protein [Planctomycetota bacterium]